DGMTTMSTAPLFACYLLTPVHAPQRLRCTYVGFTVSPTRRIRQHNGEIRNGAKRTSKHRPWEMVAVVHGFPSKFHALQFEYAWQHPYNSRFTKERLSLLKGRAGVGTPRSLKRKLIELHELLHLQPWTHFPLTVSYTSEFAHSVAKSSGYYAWRPHMKCETRALAEFKGVGNRSRSAIEDDDESAGHDDDGIRDPDTEQACCFVCEEELSGAAAPGNSSQRHGDDASSGAGQAHASSPSWDIGRGYNDENWFEGGDENRNFDAEVNEQDTLMDVECLHARPLELVSDPFEGHSKGSSLRATFIDLTMDEE
ncbi:Giyyig catalytic domain containing protein, partial [Globisporangium polare]